MTGSKGELLTLASAAANKKVNGDPLLTFVVLLANGQTLEQPATAWSEHSNDEGEGIAYNFYIHRTRVMTLEYTEVRAVFCKEHCDVEQSIKAMTAPKRRARKKKRANGNTNS